jgi:hypothetical protein
MVWLPCLGGWIFLLPVEGVIRKLDRVMHKLGMIIRKLEAIPGRRGLSTS